ncbi:MAG: cellulose binding domain-containing protein [Bacillota bacterium]
MKKRLSVILAILMLLTSFIGTNGVTAAVTTYDNTDDWLHVEGNKIVDMHGNQVWLTGTNWFGFNTGTNAFDGLWSANMKNAMAAMADRGINILRIPISVELVDQWSKGVYPTANINTYVNPELAGMHSLQLFDTAIQYCREYGMKVMIDIHSAKTDAMGHVYPVWYNGTITTETFYSVWEWLAERYKNNDTVIAFDLKNEPHGKPYDGAPYAKWDNSADINNWKAAAETAAKKILAINPKVLILVEGIESYPIEGKTYASMNEKDYYNNWWGGNLRAVRDYPIDLGIHQKQLVYSPHDYGPLVHKQPWFYEGFNQQTLYNDCWRDNWAFIHEENIAPLLMGEWGGFMDGGDNEKWMTALRDYMIEEKIHHTFWCFNANSGDTGGLVKNDFITWDEEKYALLKPSLWQNGTGKFIGLDHKIPLGKNGITVAQHYGSNTGVTPSPLQSPSQLPSPSPLVSPSIMPTATPTKTPVATSPTPTPITVSGNLTVDFYNGTTSLDTNSIGPKFRIINKGTSPVTLSDVTLRYYYTIDGEKSQNFYVDWTSAGSSNVTGRFVKMTAPAANADYYLEVGFTAGAGTLAAGSSLEIQTRIAKSDWTYYKQSNDYSFNSTAAGYTSWDRVTGYIKGALVWGASPESGTQSTPTATIVPTPTSTPTLTSTATPTATVVPTPTPSASPVTISGGLAVEFYNSNTSSYTNGVGPKFKLINKGTSSISLADVKIRYYYTIDGEKSQNFYVDWTSVGTSNVTGKFIKVSTPKLGADYYLEVGFTTAAGSIAPGQSIEIQSRFSKSDWSSYNQSNDYSFKSEGTTYGSWSKVTAYISGNLSWGVEP